MNDTTDNYRAEFDDRRKDYGPQGCAENFTLIAVVGALLLTLVRRSGGKR